MSHWLKPTDILDAYGRPTIYNPNFWEREFEFLRKEMLEGTLEEQQNKLEYLKEKVQTLVKHNLAHLRNERILKEKINENLPQSST